MTAKRAVSTGPPGGATAGAAKALIHWIAYSKAVEQIELYKGTVSKDSPGMPCRLAAREINYKAFL